MPKYDYQFKDIASLDEALEVYCRHIGMGYNRFRIDRIFNDFFPGIDPYTMSKLRKNAFNLLRSRSKKINKEDYIASQIEFLQSIRSNPNEKTKSRLAANKDLCQLLALDQSADGETADETAERIRNALMAMDQKQFSHVPEDQRLRLEIKQMEYNLAQKKNEQNDIQTASDATDDTDDTEEPTDNTDTAKENADTAKPTDATDASEFTDAEQRDFKIMLAKQLSKKINDETV